MTRPTTTLRLSLIEAADGKGGSLLDRITFLCYRYDHLNQGYQFNILLAVRIGGIITPTALVTGVVGRAARAAEVESRSRSRSGRRWTHDRTGARTIDQCTALGGNRMNTLSMLPFVPEMASEGATKFEFLFWYITISTGIVGLLVYAALLYFCVAYRRSVSRGGTPRILGSTRLELAWTVIPMFVFLSYFAAGVWVYNDAAHPPEDSMEIFIIGKQWMWKAQYPNGQRVIIGGNPRNMTEAERNSIGKLVLPVNRPVKLTLTSEDVIHDFGVPAFRAKIDVIPGRYTHVGYQPNKIGTYHIFCDQYCGTWHSLMVGKIAVVEEKEFDEWLAGYTSSQGTEHPVDGSLAHEGENCSSSSSVSTATAPHRRARRRRFWRTSGRKSSAPAGWWGRDRRRPVHHQVHPPPQGRCRGRLGGDHAGLR